MDTGRSKPKARFAQQLVEFALVVPVILTVIIVIIEFGFALNARASLTEAVKMSLPIANQLIHRSDGSTGTIINKEIVQEEIRNTIKNYFQNHNLPYHNTITVDILGIDGTDIAVVIANYTYKPFFSLPFNKILPNNGFHFRTYQIISDKTYAPNTAPSPLSTNQLASFWKTPGNLDGRRGLLKNSSINGISTEDVKKRIAFLVSFESGHQYARLFNWWGEDLLPSGLIIDFSTGNLSVKSPYYSTSFKDTKIPFVWVLTSLGFTHAVYIKDLSDHNLVNHRLNLSSNDSNLNRGITWCNQSGLFSGDCDSDDFSSDEVDNLIKRGISFLFNLTIKPYGTYENIIDKGGFLTENLVKSYALYDNTPGSQYFLKLFIPVSNYTKPSEIFKYNLKLDANGEYNVSGTKSIDIVDVYMDNDADGIPNAWDLHPEYFDANANGILDGNETTLLTSSSYISFLPNNVSSFSSTPIYSSGSASNCSSAPTYRYTYQSSTESDSIMNSIPFNLNGTLNLSSNTRTFIPKLTSIGDKLVTVKFKVEKLNSSCNVESTTNTNVYYIKTGSNYIRQLPYWSTNASTALSQKLNFIHGYNSGGTVSLNRSEELYALIGTTNGAFHPDNKVQR